jgi:hypothetical protein
LAELFQHLIVEADVRHELLEPAILVLERPQLLCVGPRQWR